MTSPKLKNGSIVVRLVISFRKDGKVKNRIVKTIGQSKDPCIIKQYKKTALSLIEQHKKGLISFPKAPEKLPIDLYSFLGKDRYNTGFEDILGTGYEKLGFSNLIKSGTNSLPLNQVLRSLVLMRAFSPASKLRSCHLLKECFNQHLSHKRVLTIMDHLSKRLEPIKEEIFSSIVKKSQNMEVLLFDVTTLYFESIQSGQLQDFGYSKDGKFNEVQLVLAVLANPEGLPMAYEVFPGSTGETKTLRAVLRAFVSKCKVKQVCVVADRAMFSENNFGFFKDLEEKEGIRAQYVVSCPLKKLPRTLQEEIFQFKRKSLETEAKGTKEAKEAKETSNVSSYCEFSYKRHRLIVSYSEKLRAQDEKKRQKLLDKLKKLCKQGKVPASQLVKNKGFRQYLKTLKGSVEIDSKKIEKDRLWDGLYGVCSNRQSPPAPELLESYRRLWKIEELFRINKHTLRMRPIYHRLTKRIKAHILICFLAYTILKWTQLKLKKAGLSFSPQELIDILKKVETFIIQDKIKGPVLSYCIPRALSKEAKKIYCVFKKDYPIRPYKMRIQTRENR